MAKITIVLAVLIAVGPLVALAADRSTVGLSHPPDEPIANGLRLPRQNDGAKLAPRPAFRGPAGSVSQMQRLAPGRVLSPDRLAEELKARGYTGVSNIRVKGDQYVVEATGPRGERVILVVNTTTNEITGARIRSE